MRAGFRAPQGPGPILPLQPGTAEQHRSSGRALVHPCTAPPAWNAQGLGVGKGGWEINTFDFVAKVNGNCYPRGDLGTRLPATASPGAGGAGRRP